MTDNPYDAPRSEPPVGDADSADARRRPAGVSLLAFLYLLVGGSRLATIIYFVSRLKYLDLYLVVRLAIAVALVASGVAMFLGRRWGWMLASTMAIFGVLSNSRGVLAALFGPAPDAIPQLFFTIVTIAVLFYLNQGHVLAYFRVPSEKRRTIMAGQIMLGIIVLVGLAMLVKIGTPDLE